MVLDFLAFVNFVWRRIMRKTGEKSPFFIQENLYTKNINVRSYMSNLKFKFKFKYLFLYYAYRVHMSAFTLILGLCIYSLDI